MAIIPKPPFPNVPKLPGVPQLARSIRFPASLPPGLGTAIAIGALWKAISAKPQWGVFNSGGTRVIAPDSVIDFGYRNEWQVSSFPVQRGAFANYNKVASPFEISVRMSKGGSLGDRSTFLAQIAAIADDLNLYKIITPERSYVGCNISRYEITRRGAQGAYLLTDVDLYFTEIRQVTLQVTSSSATVQAPKAPSATPPIDQGVIQTTTSPASAAFSAPQNVGVSP